MPRCQRDDCRLCWPNGRLPIQLERPRVGSEFWLGIRNLLAIELGFVLGGLALARAFGWLS